MKIQETQKTTSKINQTDESLDTEIKLKTENMIATKKPNEMKKLLNNPPKKETLLKGTKDFSKDINRDTFTSNKRGEFGPMRDNSNGRKMPGGNIDTQQSNNLS